MPNIDVNGQTIDYPDTGDPNWGDNATNFAIQTSAALGKIGLSSGTSVDIIQTLDVTGNTTLDANLSVGGDASVTGNTTLTGNLTVNGNTTLTGNLTVNGNTQLGNANTDTIGVTGIVNMNSGVLYVDPVQNKVGINDTTPSEALDVTGNALISGTLGVTGATSLSSSLGVTGDVAINTNKFNVTASSGDTTIAGTLGVTGNTTVDGVIYADDDTTANTPVISFTGDTNTGIGRSGADTLDFITNGNSRFRIESTGQIKAVYESTIGTDYNTRLDNGYFCRAWVNFDGTGTVAIRASGNVSSITDNGTGNYTINFTQNLPDTNYVVIGTCLGGSTSGANYTIFGGKTSNDSNTRNVGSCQITMSYVSSLGASSLFVDHQDVNIGIFR